MKLKETLNQHKFMMTTVIIGLVAFALFLGINTPTEPQTDPENIIILGTFDKSVSIGDRIYMQGTIINFPTDEKYNFELIKPSGEVALWGYKSTTTNPTGTVPFNFHVTEFGEHTFTMSLLSNRTLIASETFTLTEK